MSEGHRAVCGSPGVTDVTREHWAVSFRKYRVRAAHLDAIASVAALTPPAAPAGAVLTQVAAFAPEIGTTTLQRTRVDGQWLIPPGTHMTRIAGAWVPT